MTEDIPPLKEIASETKVGAIVCEDEDAWFEGTMFGFVASMVTKEGHGNQKLFPDSLRKIINSNRNKLTDSFKKVASRLDMVLGITSHPGCGGGNAQDIAGRDIANLTKKQCINLLFFGHLPVSDKPEVIYPEKNLKGFMDRKESDHTHKAEFVDITIGGGITFSEKKTRFQDHGRKKAFQISADWVSDALDLGMNESDAIDILALQLAIAYSIAPRLAKNEARFQIFNANRITEYRTINKNEEIARKAIEKVNLAIFKKELTTISHH